MLSPKQRFLIAVLVSFADILIIDATTGIKTYANASILGVCLYGTVYIALHVVNMLTKKEKYNG